MLYASNNYACSEATCVSKSYFFSGFSKHMWLFGGIEGRNRGYKKRGTASTPYG